ncbi:hypothetical protein cyc_06111 [Cyclospora cayetanensis]|uniref:Uncharacterized protein n=1 Tax=Cyclospora cayetanensis TaxID=88456 RepID=A0A1D3D412_9EIME|nr:hypothetical protein cyc_06111 [Cyclospora cayetanensis]
MAAHSEGGALYGIPRDFRSLQPASESTEADENSPDPRRNSVSPSSYTTETSMALPVKDDFVIGRELTVRDLASPKRSSQNASQSADTHPERSTCSDKEGSNGFTFQPPEAREDTKVISEGEESSSVAHSVRNYAQSHCGTPRTFKSALPSACAIDVESDDDGVAVYIDVAEDDDTSAALLIEEYRVSAKSAAEIRVSKSRWVEKMLERRDRILGPAFDGDEAVKDSGRSNSSTLGAERMDAAETADCGSELLQRKLEAFAACMTPEMLDSIYRRRKAWSALPCDSPASDTAESSDDFSHAACRGQGRPKALQSVSKSQSQSAEDAHASEFVPQPRSESLSERTDELGEGPALAALNAWSHFLRYARMTCRVVPPRPRIERHEGLESDDDDEQAPLYMCRPGSVQRPSPLISRSLTEHLKASHTIFFKRFRRQCATEPPHCECGSVPAAATEQVQPCVALDDSRCRSEPAAARESSADGCGVSADTNDGDPAVPKEWSAEMATQGTDDPCAVPLYTITDEASALFGDIMRLEDTARMLEASCTFRLAAAPFSKIRRPSWKKRETPNTQEHSNLNAPPHMKIVSSPASAAPLKSSATVTGAPEHRSDFFTPVPASAHETSAVESSQLGANAYEGGPPEGPLNQQGLVTSTPNDSEMHGDSRLSPAGRDQRTEFPIIYTVQADEDTLALSGLDAEYCARVEFASRRANRTAETLICKDSTQESGDAGYDSTLTSMAAQKRRRRMPVDENAISSENDSESECTPLDDDASGVGCPLEVTEEGGHDRSLMADKLLLAHLMPYLPQFGP